MSEQELEISIEDAVKVIEAKGGKAFTDPSKWEEMVQNSKIFEAQKNKTGMAYKKSGQMLADLFGIETEEGERFEDIVEKARVKLLELTKEPKKQDPQPNPEFEALKTEKQEWEQQKKTFEEQLNAYKSQESKQAQIKALREAINGRKLDVPEGLDAKHLERIQKGFEEDILSKVEWITDELGQQFIKVDGHTYSDINSKLSSLIDESGYKFKSASTKDTLPTEFTEASLSGLDENKRREMMKKELDKKGITGTGEAFWKVRQKYGFGVPDNVLQKFPNLKA